jgi:S1-C subfamily serine protease
MRRSTVKILNTFARTNTYMPWKQDDSATLTGSGTLIEGNLIITNAHVVSDSTFLQVQRENDPNYYDARVLFLGHDCDLALVTVKDPGFFKGTTPVSFGGIPDLQSKVAAYGYPEGGERISITEGIVSRIEVGPYTHSGRTSLLTIQTDAAINPGNSGGPVVQRGKLVGISFQTRTQSSNIGFLIPVPVIRHFLEDVKDGAYDGFPSLGIIDQELQNKSHRDFLSMKKGQSGVLITHVLPGGSADGKLRQGDIVLKIDGTIVANDGTYRFLDNRIRYTDLIDRRQIGQSASVTVLRGGAERQVTVELKAVPVRIPWFNEFDVKPRYVIIGGIIFQNLSKEYLKIWNEWWSSAGDQMLYPYFFSETDGVDNWRREFVLINHVLPDPSNTYISDISDKVVDSINGRKISRLEDVVDAFRQPEGKFHVIRTQGTTIPIVLQADQIRSADESIARKYGIETMSDLGGRR